MIRAVMYLGKRKKRNYKQTFYWFHCLLWKSNMEKEDINMDEDASSNKGKRHEIETLAYF